MDKDKKTSQPSIPEPAQAAAEMKKKSAVKPKRPARTSKPKKPAAPKAEAGEVDKKANNTTNQGQDAKTIPSKAKTKSKPTGGKKKQTVSPSSKTKIDATSASAPQKSDQPLTPTNRKQDIQSEAMDSVDKATPPKHPKGDQPPREPLDDKRQAGQNIKAESDSDRDKASAKAAAPQKHDKRPHSKPTGKSDSKKIAVDNGGNKLPSCKLLINAEEPEECRIALLEDGKLEAFYIETASRERTKGNIYKGKIVSIETNLQAAFVDIGTGKNAFLPFSEIHPEYYSEELPSDSHWKDVNFKECLKIGQEVLLEVVKEPTGNKGANMTTFLSLPGRYVVLMPGSDSHGISRQIESQEQRHKLREMLESCKLPEGVGYIIRTASKEITKTALTTDVRFLIKLWNEIKQQGQTKQAPALIYGEQNIITRFLRDHFSPEIREILVDSQESYKQVASFLDLLPAAQIKKTTARLHKGPRPLLNSYNIEEQIEQIYRPTVKLPSGGSIVINPTEALVAIDVNSGSTGKDKNFAETIFLANMEAAEELARQLRLRDLGGLIVVDFIDMRPAAHIREVEKKVKASMKRDKAKVDFARISKFGLMQISRQRMGSPIAARNYVPCEYCKGRGIVRSVETQALAYLRQIQTGVSRKNIKTVRCRLPMDVSQYLLNKKRTELAEIERRYQLNIIVEISPNLKPANAGIDFLKD